MALNTKLTIMKQPLAIEKKGIPAGIAWTGLEETLVENESEPEFYRRIISRMETRMMRSIWRIVRETEDAEDTLQDALATIWRRLDRIRVHSNPEALVLKMCIDAAYDTLRKQKRHRRDRQDDSGAIATIPANKGMTAQNEIEGHEIQREILDAIGRLPRKQAVAVLMRIVQEQPYDIIAEALACSETTVRIHVSKGRKRLSRWLAHLNQTGATFHDQEGEKGCI